MESPSVRALWNHAGAGIARLLVGLSCLGFVSAQALTITVRGTDGTMVNAYRYTIEEDTTFDVVPDVTGLAGDPTLSLAFHRSHARVVQVGHSDGGGQVVFSPTDTTKRYYVSVLPDNASFGTTASGYTMNGMPIRAAASGTFPDVVVPVNPLPFKTSQISVFVFEDNSPINGAADAPGVQESALCGWEVQLFEAGGTYGASGGRMSTDTFGNPLGTEYALNADGSPRYNPDGSLMYSKLGANQLWTDRNGVVRIKNLSPAKYTVFSIAPPVMPSVQRCNFADANGNPTNVPIWIATEAQRTRADQVVWDNGFEIAPSIHGQDQSKWHQTTTIEGTWGVDAWVKSGEPAFFKEFGPPGHHVWHGFVRRFKDTSTAGLSGPATVSGKVVSTHMSRPPGIRFYSGAPMAACWIGLNEVATGVGLGRTLYANSCSDDPAHAGEFAITGLKAGQRYQLAVWDEPLDNVMANYEFVMPADGSNLNLTDVPVFSWFSNLQGKVFYDKEGTGFPYDSVTGQAKPGIPGSVVNIRFRDGSIYNSTVTDDEGYYQFAEVFPFFNWMVAETDFTRFKATGATIIADDGGAPVNPPITQPDLWPANTLTPQPQPENGDQPWRIFGFANANGTGAANPSSANLLQNFQGFLGQTNVIHWGKSEYNPADANDHGGITGVVHYASTRAENDPKFATPENNEPGIPNVEIRLYRLNNQNKVVAPNGAIVEPSAATLAHAVQLATTDSFDNAMPENCVDRLPYVDRAGNSFATGTHRSRCYDGMRIWNQVRDGVFDGGFGFVDFCPAGLATDGSCNPDPARTNSTEPVPLPPGRYMIEGVAPYGYEHQKEEDKNVDFGDLLVPGTLSNPAECLGSRDEALDDNGLPYFNGTTPNLVPATLTLFEGVDIPARFRDTYAADGTTVLARRPYCNKKLVVVAPGMNPFGDFHMFTKTPVAGHIVGMILDDLANEFDPYAPSFGEKYAPPFMPISIRDYAGNEINRVYSDRYGTYNALVPSSFAFNVPMPSGVAPNMVNVCLNSPTMKDPVTGGTVIDPHYNPQYTQYCYTFQYLPGKTTYLDTPVLPIAAFAGPSQYALDTEQPDGTPGIKMVTGQVGGNDVGPWVPAAGGTVRIMSMGLTRVNNPAYDQNDLGTPGVNAAPKTIERNYGFGTAAGQVFIGGAAIAAANVTWANDVITVNVPAGVSGTVEVLGANGRRSVRGATLHAGTVNMAAGRVRPITVGQGGGYDFASIQAAIDATGTVDGDLITVAPGLYEEAPIVWKRVRVQGYGAPATIINAAMGADYVRQAAWRQRACDLVLNQGMASALLPGQAVPANMTACLTGDTVDNAPLLFASEEASGFFVLQKPLAGNAASFANGPFIAASTNNNTRPVRALQIDGFTVTGADTGGGIVANGNAIQLQISNNRIVGNQGLYNGGIRIGHADLNQADLPVDANNLLVNIHHNEILKNGNTAGEVVGGGGGISIYTGARGYRVAHNYIAGNFSTGDGGGMAHFGQSGSYSFAAVGATVQARLVTQDNRSNIGPAFSFASTVSDNQFRFNQSFNQAKSVQGGGLAIIGIVDPAGTGIALGTGDVTVINNTFQGNLAGAGDGGGIALVGVNGSGDINALNGLTPLFWNRVDILNNVIVNNGAGVAGGGISLQDAANVNIVNNTIAMNDSYATAARAFQGGTNPTQASNCAQGLGGPGCLVIAESVLQNGAGIAAYGHSGGLLARLATLGTPGKSRWFSDARVVNSVVLGNRSYNWRIDYSIDQATCSYNAANGSPCFGLSAAASQTRSGNDVAVLFAPAATPDPTLASSYSVLSALNVGDGTAAGASNVQGDATLPGIDFSSAYAIGSNGALKQLMVALEQSVPIGAPVLEVQEPTVATTAAAFDEGGNFIDVRFGPLTRGGLVAGNWVDFGTYNPTTAAATAGGHFSLGQSAVTLVWPKLSTDINGVARSNGNFVRGALAR
jgi:large repetitive protein